jgi:hypothetical protein
MFFAVVDRGRLDGTIRNGVMYVHDRHGEQLALYNFSINKDNLPERPFRTGALYLLPREAFDRELFGGEAPSNEWVSLSPVRPAAHLVVDPDDFPFLTRIGGHDDGPIVRSDALQRRLLDGAEKAHSLGPEQRELVFRPEPGLEADVREFIALQGELMPGVEYAFDPGPPPSLVIGAMPPAMVQILDADLERRGLLEAPRNEK